MPKRICLTQVYNEEWLIANYWKHIYPHVDTWIITEGLLSPHINQAFCRSTDSTRFVLDKLSKEQDPDSKVIVVDSFHNPNCKSREQAEGLNKNKMLDIACPNDGDIIFIGDCDEFWGAGFMAEGSSLDRCFEAIIDSQHDHVALECFNFVYNLKQGFKGSIDGRFMRYRAGDRFGDTNHFIGSDGKDKTKNHSIVLPLEFTNLLHLSYAKHPLTIKAKVKSFNRRTFTNWYNYCYLEGAENLEVAYHNNQKLSREMGWPGTGWAEGQTAKVESFDDFLPHVLYEYESIDHTDFIKENKQALKI